MQTLRVARFLPGSRANGPGARAVVWMQGCTLGCPGCFNPEMQPPEGGTLTPVDALFAQIVALGDAIEGVSFSGGEPLQQFDPLLALLERIRRETALSTLIFTGYTWDEVQVFPAAAELLACADVFIAGRYDATQPLGHGMLGSANQTIHLLTDRYTLADIQAVPPAEVVITETGDVVISGVAPFELERVLKQKFSTD
ncbi:MAG TPA: 4Fe-4S single cluster domain-containing protein [Anaerolineae bacterium]|nr:4Fe-4S single cluster domain-containing protein [Anaerolineae bacterium]